MKSIQTCLEVNRFTCSVLLRISRNIYYPIYILPSDKSVKVNNFKNDEIGLLPAAKQGGVSSMLILNMRLSKFSPILLNLN